MEGDTVRSIRKMIHYAIEQNIFIARFSVSTPYPGTDYYNLLDKKGIFNLGGPTKTVYNFAKKYNKNVKKKINNKNSKRAFPLNCSMNLSKLNILINKT